jgi:outer membrane protein OmpA-like peptidoglycan-associated protein
MGMKWRVLSIVCALVVTSVVWTPAFSQNYYLVIGAFATEHDNIKEFTSYLPGTFSDTAYTVKTDNSLMHFYVMKTSDKDQALAKSIRLQQEILKGGSHTVNTVSPELNNQGSGIIENSTTLSTAMTPPTNLSASSSITSDGMPASGAPSVKPRGQYFKFTILKDDGGAFPGEVHHIDPVQQLELGSFNTDTYVDVLRPGTKEMTMVCGVFGYKEVQKFIDYSNPSLTEGAYLDEHGAWVIPYTLERLEKGDVSVMYNVSFIEDAVVMEPPSKKDLDELVNLMNSNPNYVIKVHAHCNGKNARTMTILGDNRNYFDVTGAIEHKGSAKELTNLRADAIRSYLEEQGISPERVRTYGWGGSDMMVEKDSPHARLNDRIEIEILKD